MRGRFVSFKNEGLGVVNLGIVGIGVNPLIGKNESHFTQRTYQGVLNHVNGSMLTVIMWIGLLGLLLQVA